jgi:hypothetical protein
MISAVIADAEERGAKQMREAVESALDDLPLPDGFFVSDIMCAINDALPLPTGPRQAVRRAEDKFDAIRISEKSPWWSGDHWCCEDADWYPLLRAIETAVLAANGLETK